MKKDIERIPFTTPYSKTLKFKKFIWNIFWNVTVRPFPKWFFRNWRRFIIRFFGGKIAPTAHIYPTVKIFMPWNLEMGEYSCLADNVDCYNPAKITLEANTTVSKRAFLCTASHNISSPYHEQTEAPIIIKERAWVAAEAYVGPGVTIGEGAVVGARACVYKDVKSWTVVGGNPAKYIKDRVIKY